MSSAVLRPFGVEVLTASGGRTAKHWDVESGECVKNLAATESS